MNYKNGDQNVIDMDTHDLYLTWENGYPYATKGRGEEAPLSREQELELMADKIVCLEVLLANTRKIALDEIEQHSNTRQQLDIAKATGAA